MNDLEWRLTVCREAVEKYPGHMIDWYAPSLAVKLGVTEKKISEYFQMLVKAGEIVERSGKFYPASYKTSYKLGEEEDKKREEALLKYLEQAQSPQLPEIVTNVTEEKTVTWQELVKHEAKPDMENYILVYDLERAKLSDSEWRRLYREIEKAYHQILREGRWAERIQRSVWKFENREDALRIASILPESMAKIRIFRVLEEV
jgi:hypothetical protein